MNSEATTNYGYFEGSSERTHTAGDNPQRIEQTVDSSDTAFPCDNHKGETKIGPYDVLCGRSKLSFNNTGNRRFRVTVALNLERYLKALTRQGKTNVIISVADQVRQNGGRFLKWNRRTKDWELLDDKRVRGKVGHALRDMATARENSTQKPNSNGTSSAGGCLYRNPRFFYTTANEKGGTSTGSSDASIAVSLRSQGHKEHDLGQKQEKQVPCDLIRVFDDVDSDMTRETLTAPKFNTEGLRPGRGSLRASFGPILPTVAENADLSGDGPDNNLFRDLLRAGFGADGDMEDEALDDEDEHWSSSECFSAASAA